MPPLRVWLLVLVATLLGQRARSGPHTCPSACFCDAQLSVTCEGDTLWSIPDDIPAGVRRLELRSFVVPTLTAAQLTPFSNLTEFKAQRNNIASIENGTFSVLNQLLKLDLSQNLLSQVTAGTLSGMLKATNLDLSSNRLTSVEGAFVSMSSLEQLTLRSNKLTMLGPRTLIGLQRLQYLNIDSNQITDIDVSAFQPLENLAHLILSNNPLNNLSRLEFFGSRLQYIDVSAVGLTVVPQSLTQYVRDLRLAKNNLTMLRRGDFDSYPYLGLLVLDDCGIRHLEEDTLGRHEHLMRLWLNGNLLQSVPASLPVGLKALYLEENQIRVLRRDEFQGLSALEQLFMQRNLIDTVEQCAFCGLPSLRNLDLQANKIRVIPASSFSGLVKLETLDLSQNPLTALEPGSLRPLVSLKSLQLSRLKNNISTPDSLFDTLEKLDKLEMFDSAQLVTRVINSGRLMHGIRSVSQLNVMHNQLSRLRSDLPQLLPRLRLLKLGGSWWNCSDPDILWLTDWIAEGRIQFYSPFSARCRLPPRLMLKSVARLTDEDFETVPTMRPEDDASRRPATNPNETGSTNPTPTTASTSDSELPTRVGGGTTATTALTTSISTSATAETIPRPSSAPSPVSTLPKTPKSSESPSTASGHFTETTVTHNPSSTSPQTSAQTHPTKTWKRTTATSQLTYVPPASSTSPTSLATREATPATLPPTYSAATATAGITVLHTTVALTTSPRAAEPFWSSLPGAGSDPAPSGGRIPLPIASASGDSAERQGLTRPVLTTAARRGSMVVVLSSLAATAGVLMLLLAAAVALWRYRRAAVHPFIRRRKGSSISYSHQKDEVNILEEECGGPADSSGSTGGGGEGGGAIHDCRNGGTHHGLSNALYMLAQCGEADFSNRLPRPVSLLPAAAVDACPRAVSDAWATPSPDAARW